MGLLGTKTSFFFVICFFYWPPSSLQNYDLTRIFCKKCSPILFNISQSIMAVRKMKEVFVDGPLKNIKFLHFWKIHLGLVTICFAKQWLKQEICAKCPFLLSFSSFHLFVLLNVLLSLWIKFIVGESIFISFYYFTTSLFTFTIYLWLLL